MKTVKQSPEKDNQQEISMKVEKTISQINQFDKVITAIYGKKYNKHDLGRFTFDEVVRKACANNGINEAHVRAVAKWNNIDDLKVKNHSLRNDINNLISSQNMIDSKIEKIENEITEYMILIFEQENRMYIGQTVKHGKKTYTLSGYKRIKNDLFLILETVTKTKTKKKLTSIEVNSIEFYPKAVPAKPQTTRKKNVKSA
jgi:hypothetical protein